jgi:site-specific DNA recombinase
MRVATYLRISTDEERQPYSLEAQAERLSGYIAVQSGWRLVLTHSDRMTGKLLDRPGLQQALHDARAGRYDLLLVFKVDRLARSVSGLAKVLEELDAAGVAFRSASEPFDTTTAAGRMMVQMLGVFAEFEREMIVERTRMGLARKAAKGEWTGGRPPFGYRYDPAGRLLVPTRDRRRWWPGSSTCTSTVGWVRRRSATCSTTTGRQPAVGAAGRPTASWTSCATPPTLAGSPSMARPTRRHTPG